MPKQPARAIYKAVRFSAVEWAAVEAQLEGREFGAAARALFTGASIPERLTRRPSVEIKRRMMSAAEAEKIRQLAAFGSNLNQIARAANAAAKGGKKLEILASLVALERAIKQAANDL